jgi:hypothetical protein
MGADVHGSRQVPFCADLDDDGPGLAGSRVLAPVLPPRLSGH